MTPPSATKLQTDGGSVVERVARVEEKLDALSTATKGMDANFGTLLRDIADRLRKMETDTALFITSIQSKVDDAKDDIYKLECRVDAVEKSIPEKLRDRVEKIESNLPGLLLTNKILIFIGSALLVSIIGLLWALLTGQKVITTIP